MKKLLFLILTLLTAVNVSAASMHKAISAVSAMLPMNAEYGSLVAISYDGADNEVVAVFKCTDDYLSSFNKQKEITLAAFVTGALLAQDQDISPFNLVINIKTHDNSTKKTFYETEETMASIIETARSMFTNPEQIPLDKFISKIQELPMQCDPAGAFCCTFDFDRKANDIVINMQILDDNVLELIEAAKEEYVTLIGKQLATPLKIFESLMTTHNIGVRIRMFKGTANEPFFTVRLSPEDIFGE